MESAFSDYRNARIERRRYSTVRFGMTIPHTDWHVWIDGEDRGALRSKSACMRYVDSLHGEEFTPEFAACLDRDTNDCTVKAIAIACEAPYETVHSMLAAHGRQPGEGACYDQFLPVARELGYVVRRFQTSARTVRSFAALRLRGSFLVIVKGHVCCVRDGQIHDRDRRSLRRIVDVYRVKAAAAVPC